MIAFQFVPVLVVCNCSSSRGSQGRRKRWQRIAQRLFRPLQSPPNRYIPLKYSTVKRISDFYIRILLTLVHDSQKIQNEGPSPSVFPGKILSIASHHFVYVIYNLFPCFGMFSRQSRSVKVPKIGIYSIVHEIVHLDWKLPVWEIFMCFEVIWIVHRNHGYSTLCTITMISMYYNHDCVL